MSDNCKENIEDSSEITLSEISSGLEELDDVSFEEMEDSVQTRNTQLKERINSLQAILNDLRGQLSNEKELWKKELEETLTLKEKMASCHCFNHTCSNTSMDVENIMKNQALKKAQLQRQIAITNYRRRLLEVENMCNMELFRVKQSVQSLHPLRLMASNWTLEDENKPEHDEEAGIEKSDSLTTLSDPVSLETLSNKLYSDMSKRFNSSVSEENCPLVAESEC